MPTTKPAARKAAVKKPAPKKAVAKKVETEPVAPIKPIPLERVSPYIKVGCRRVWLDPKGFYRSKHDHSGVSVPGLMIGDGDEYNDGMDTEEELDFEAFMLAMYELAKLNGIEIPPVPAD